MNKPIITIAPPLDDAQRLADTYTDTDRGDHIERVFDVAPLTAAERAQRALAACHTARRAAYPPIGDQLDAAFKARRGDPAPLTAIDAAIAAVKAAYPKP